MEILISIILWIIFAGIPTMIVLIPIFFVLKSKGMNKLLHYLVSSSFIGFVVIYLLKLVPYVLSGLIEQRSAGVHIVSNGSITIDGYIHFASDSILGALIAGTIGFCWWYFLVNRQKPNQSVNVDSANKTPH